MYNTILVGTDGSKSSFLAVRRAAGIAHAVGARLVLASAYYKASADAMAASRGESRTVVGDDVAEEILGDAKAVAMEEGVSEPKLVLQEGSPVEALIAVATKEQADLLVVGNRGINSLTGRLLGSVPADAARQAQCDVMIVHTVD
ncbi:MULTISPECIES: universal stress protein [Corynebacterium]|uniref:Stress protein n=1 Tax=Corynebacterium auriscanis TaxID=99807 RepID=A0A0A2DIV8_9CORY|nr:MULTISPECIES: universal stress protein [Corynebacterium]KGM19140.1 stress protein [Corynebacterium auriscanis]MCX2163239.1 universal stress protein [Corynebacterium auriscanis]OFT91641.1 stress protein [Corynebacterium sp. HMSC28B08]WJY72572.1 Universal stress protein [Corynebacterium auriscanis]